MEETYKGVVYPWQCDHMGHLNVAHYVGKFDEATWCLFAGVGLDVKHFRENSRGMAALEQHLTYNREVIAGEIVVVRSRWLTASKKVVSFRHEMFGKGDQLAATCEITAIYMDTARRKSEAFASEINDKLNATVTQPLQEANDESQ
ncbi:MAG: thioesterase family protein [Alphaproteobacteria bacterium]